MKFVTATVKAWDLTLAIKKIVGLDARAPFRYADIPRVVRDLFPEITSVFSEYDFDNDPDAPWALVFRSMDAYAEWHLRYGPIDGMVLHSRE